MPRLVSYLAFSAALLMLAACTVASPSKTHRDPVDPGADFGLDNAPQEEQPLGSEVASAFPIIHRFAAVLAQAERECGPW